MAININIFSTLTFYPDDELKYLPYGGVFIFAFITSQEPFAKIKTSKILLPTCKANELRFNPWPTSIQQPTKSVPLTAITEVIKNAT